MEHDRRVWVLPALLVVLCLSIPAQIAFAERVSEPYPGLFQPRFHGISQGKGHVVKVPRLTVAVDGRRVDPAEFKPGKGHSRDEFLALFTSDDRGSAPIDEATRRWLRSAVMRSWDSDPQELAVTWQCRRYDLDPGKFVKPRTIAEYRVDLREDVR